MNPVILRRLPIRALKAGSPDGKPLLPVEEKFEEAVRSTMTGQPIPESTWLALPWVPRAARRFTAQLLEREDILNHLETNSAAAFYVLTAAGMKLRERFMQLSENLEPAVLSDGETLAIYLSWANQSKTILPHPQEIYRDAMIRCPLHGVRWAQLVGDSTFTEDLLNWAFTQSREDAAAAWTVIVAESLNPLPYRSVLALDPLYAVAAAARFGMKFSLSDFQTELNGRWMFHLLLNDGCSEPDEVEAKLLESDPAWAMEWLIETDDILDPQKWAAVLQTVRLWKEQDHPLLNTILYSLRALSAERNLRIAQNGDAQESDDEDDDDDTDEDGEGGDGQDGHPSE